MDQREKVLHLLRRTGFGTNKEIVNTLASLSIATIVDQILNEEQHVVRPNIDLIYRNQNEVITWLYNRIVSTNNSFLEKMTLFWHNHFTSSIDIAGASEMANQNILLQRHALGNFKTFLYEISIDPAMLVYLSNRSNVKLAPNENYAREIMELFSLGVNQYSQDDVKNVARALTGWRYNRTHKSVYFDKNVFDSDSKIFLRHRGNFDLNDIVRIITEHRQCAYFIVKKIWNKFVFPNPTDSEIQPFVNRFYDGGYDIKLLMRDIFTSDIFYSPKAYRSIIKDPTEFAVELMRKIPTYFFNYNEIGNLATMGMPLMKPPNVAGWKEGGEWLSSTLYFARGTYAAKVINTATYESLGLTRHSDKVQLVNSILDFAGMYDISTTTKDQIMQYANSTTDYNMLLRGILYLLYVSPEGQLK